MQNPSELFAPTLGVDECLEREAVGGGIEQLKEALGRAAIHGEGDAAGLHDCTGTR